LGRVWHIFVCRVRDSGGASAFSVQWDHLIRGLAPDLCKRGERPMGSVLGIREAGGGSYDLEGGGVGGRSKTVRQR